MLFNVFSELLYHLLKLIWFVSCIQELNMELIILIFKGLNWNLQWTLQIYLWFQ